MDVLENRAQWLADFEAGWLAHYTATGETDWKIYNKPTNKTTIAGDGLDLSQSRLVLVTSAGSYLPTLHATYDDENLLGDYSIRRYPTTTDLRALKFAHTHYDHTAVEADPQVLVPLQHLRDMVTEGTIGALAAEVISFHGYQPNALRTVDETATAILAAAQDLNADAALLVPS